MLGSLGQNLKLHTSSGASSSSFGWIGSENDQISIKLGLTIFLWLESIRSSKENRLAQEQAKTP